MHLDVVIVGSGASGLTTSIRAARGGLKVLVLEKASEFGGTTAVSGGGGGFRQPFGASLSIGRGKVRAWQKSAKPRRSNPAQRARLRA